MENAAAEREIRALCKRIGVAAERVECFRVPTDRSWTRDSCPIFVRRDDGDVAAVGWRFNGWAKYPNHKRDEKVPAAVARVRRSTLFTPTIADGARPRRLVLEGGAIDVNGCGTLLATEECLLSDVQARNPGLDRAGTRGGAARRGSASGTSCGSATASPATTRTATSTTSPASSIRAPSCSRWPTIRATRTTRALQDNLERLSRATDQDGRPLRVVPLPMPAPLAFEDYRLPASYANFYVGNAAVLVPTFNDPADRRALATLAALFPDRRVVGIHAVRSGARPGDAPLHDPAGAGVAMRSRERGVARGALLGLAVASVVVALLGVEAALRVAARFHEPTILGGRPWLIDDPIVGQRNRPGFTDPSLGIAINALGLRGPEVTVAKPAGTVRVLCLGDSTTFGVWRNDVFEIRFDTSYPAELAQLLQARGVRAEVLNAGVMGYTTAHALRLLLTELRSLAPDVVTVRLGNNDHTLVGLQPWYLSVTTPYDLLRRLPAGAFHWQIVRLGVDGYQRWTGPQRRWQQTYKVPIEEFERNLHRLIETARGMGANPLLLDFPYRPIDQGPWQGEALPNSTTEARNLEELHAIHDRYQVVVERVARETGVPFVATAPALRAQPVRTFTDFDNSHPNAAGLHETGVQLLDALVRLGWVGPPATAGLSNGG